MPSLASIILTKYISYDIVLLFTFTIEIKKPPGWAALQITETI